MNVSTMPTNTNFMTNMQARELQENPGQAIRMPATALLTVDTADEMRKDAEGFLIQPYNANQIYINKGKNIVEGYFTRVALSEINLNWNIPNVISASGYANNTLTFEQGAALGSSTVVATKTISLLEAMYSPITLAQQVQNRLNGSGGTFGSTTWNVGWSNKYSNFTIANSDNIPFRVHPRNDGNNDDLCYLMGLLGAKKTFHEVLVGGYAPFGCYTPYIDLVSNQLTKKQNVRDAGTNSKTGLALLTRVYLTQEGFNVRKDSSVIVPESIDTTILGCAPFTFHKEFQVPKQIFWDTKEFINVIDIEVRDSRGRVLYTPINILGGVPIGDEIGLCDNNTSYQFTFMVTET